MKKVLSLVIFGLVFGFAISQAHGGVSQVVNNALVFLNQSPLSPLVGEKVQFAFSFKDKNFQSLANMNVKLTLIDTFSGDESKDKVILEQQLETDTNGTLVFEQTFNKENYFDLELSFSDPITHETDTTGFLVQPRKNQAIPRRDLQITAIALVLMGGFVAISRRKKT